MASCCWCSIWRVLYGTLGAVLYQEYYCRWHYQAVECVRSPSLVMSCLIKKTNKMRASKLPWSINPMYPSIVLVYSCSNSVGIYYYLSLPICFFKDSILIIMKLEIEIAVHTTYHCVIQLKIREVYSIGELCSWNSLMNNNLVNYVSYSFSHLWQSYLLLIITLFYTFWIWANRQFHVVIWWAEVTTLQERAVYEVCQDFWQCMMKLSQLDRIIGWPFIDFHD